MMPLFPPPPLKFRTVGFPEYGFKAGRSDGAFPSQRPLSSRMEALNGRRMMPLFPPPPLKFRTAGFPEYGFKAGMSDGTFPSQAPAEACSRHTRLLCRFASILRMATE